MIIEPRFQPTLPGEDEFSETIRTELEYELKFGSAFLGTCVSILTERYPRVAITEDNHFACRIAHALCAKLCKTFRSTLALAQIGATHDIEILCRTAFETSVALLFVLRPTVKLDIDDFDDSLLTSDLRAKIYAAHYSIHRFRDFSRLKSDTRFNTAVRAKVDIEKLKQAAVADERQIGAFWSKRIARPPRTYSGFNLKELADKLDPDFSMWYAVAYGLQSKPVHAVDAIHHVKHDEEHGRMLVKWHTSIESVRDLIIAMSGLLLKSFCEFDLRFCFEDSPTGAKSSTAAELNFALCVIAKLQRKHFPPYVLTRDGDTNKNSDTRLQ